MSEIKEIPKRWKVVKLGEYVISVKGKKPKHISNEKTKECSIPYVNIKAFEKNVIDEYTDGIGCALCKDGDFLMVWDGSRSGYVGKGINGALGSTLVKLDFPNINNNYAYYFLQSKFIEINTRAKGVGIPHVDPNILWNYDLLIPPNEIQTAIVSKIEELFSDLDKAIESIETAQIQIKTYRRSVLKWAFEGKLTNKNVKDGELPLGWKKEKLRAVCEIKRGKSKNRPRNEPTLYGGPYPFIQTGDIRDANGGYIFKYTQTYSEKGLQQSKLWKKGTLCITIAANIGETAILGIDACFPDSVVGLVCNEELLLNKYTNYFFISFKSKLDKLAPATAQKNINVEILEKVEIPVPPIKEQQIIIEAIEGRLSVADKLEESISQSLVQAEALRQSILKKAFEGKLVKLNAPNKVETKVIQLNPEESEAKIIPLIPEEFPRIIPGVAATDLHAGVISMIIKAHEESPEHLSKMNHVKCEKIVHLVENMVGISLGREPIKDAAGPDDYSHLKKVEHRANMAGYFKTQDLSIGHTYQSMRGIGKIIDKTKAALTEKEYKEVSDLINIFLKFDMEHAEVIATLYAGWNNLLIQGKTPTDDEIIKESREDWSARKLTIDRQKFVKALAWMKQHNFIPEGKGKLVVKKETVKKGKKAGVRKRTNGNE